jgi:hypothetical protein
MGCAASRALLTPLWPASRHNMAAARKARNNSKMVIKDFSTTHIKYPWVLRFSLVPSALFYLLLSTPQFAVSYNYLIWITSMRNLSYLWWGMREESCLVVDSCLDLSWDARVKFLELAAISHSPEEFFRRSCASSSSYCLLCTSLAPQQV